MERKSYLKRSLIMLLVAWITFMSVFQAYQKTTEAAEWVGGLLGALGGGPVLTVLLMSGCVVAGGIALYELAQTTPEDHRNFVSGLKQGFQEFVSDQEKQIALEQDQTLTDQEAANIGVAVARDKVNNFFSNAIETTKNTVSGITASAWEYWELYSSIINDVADNGLGVSDGDLLPKNLLPGSTSSGYGETINQIHSYFSENNVTVEVEGSNYICGGDFYYYNGSSYIRDHYNNSNYLLFIGLTLTETGIKSNVYRSDINTGNIWGVGQYSYEYGDGSTNYGRTLDKLITAMSMSSLPIVISSVGNFAALTRENRSQYISVNGTSMSDIPVWKRTIKNTLDNTHFGNAIQTGRRQLTNEGDWVGSIFKDNTIPVKKSGILVNDGVVTAPVGWDIPAGSTWDDVFSGGKPYADVVGQTGAIGVPDDVITGTKQGDTVVEYPDTADVQDTADYPRDTTDNPPFEDSRPQEIPDKPQQEIIEDQGGTFYPSTMDLTNIFPFCIPFDIIYLVDKFDVQGERAPVITIPIIYPNAIRSTIGSDSYEVTIDFEDFIVVRNVIRVFLLILFIVGLLKITRDLIRG